ncbi:hypothetical protein J6W91_01880 [Candidatus Saccharibacteria bacterium]|nr:hypothetical protein [Candidatus Saccharibacteria bacterium]
MKIKKKLVHALPLTAILGVSGLAIAGTTIVKNSVENASASDDSAIAMTVTGNLDFDIVPEVGGVYAEKSLDVTVNTTNAAGYSLYMSSKDNSSATSDTSEGGIVSIDTQYTKADMPINSWGYYVGSEYLNPIPASDAPAMIAETDAPSNDSNKTTKVTFGVKVAPNLKSGDYKNTVSFTATPNTTCGGFFCIETMQSMTPSICAATTTPLSTAREVTYTYTTDNTKIPRTILTDTRDNKKYLVSKFADGKCWMSQNLELELSSATALSYVDTDLNSKQFWTPSADTGSTTDAFNQYDYGMVYDGPEAKAAFYTSRSMRPTTAYLQGGIVPSTTASTNDGKSEWEKAGIYYNFQAATAGSGEDLFEEEENGEYDEYNYYSSYAEDSICPKGWRLPNIDYYGENDDGHRFQYAYEGIGYGDFVDMSMFSDLLAFNAQGFIGAYYGGTYSYGLGSESKFWTSGKYDLYYKDAATIEASSNYVYTSSEYMQSGLPVRCIAR